MKRYENGNKEKYSQLVPGSAESRIYAGKITKRGFSKKGIARIDIFFVLGSYSRVWNKRSPTLISFLTFFPGATALFRTP